MNVRRNDKAAPAGRARPRWQRGVTMLEVLVAILVLALGLLGVVGVQMRVLADTQTGVRRAQAIRLIEDLSERIHANPNALFSDVLGNYVVPWGDADEPGDCGTAADGCAAKKLAVEQIRAWKQSVKQNLPSGDAMTFIPSNSSQQLGVLVSWRQNERDTSVSYVGVFSDTASTPDAACAENKTCHLQFISVTGRCPVDAQSRDPQSGASRLFCPGGIVSLPTL